MAKKLTYKELEQRVQELENEVAKSERVKNELQLERTIFLGGPVVVFKWLAIENWPAEYVSPNVTQFGYEADDFISGRTHYIDIIHPEDSERVVSEVIEHIESGDSFYEQEYRIIQGDGEVKWVYDFTIVRRNDKGEIMHYDGYILDITDRKLAEEALRESEEKYRSMMETMNDAIYICSSDYRVMYMNPAMIRRIGREAIGEPCHKVINDLDEICPFCVHDKIQQGEHYRTEIVSPRDGRFFHVSHSPIFHADGSISKMSIYHDQTERKQAEKVLQQRTHDLGERVKELNCLYGISTLVEELDISLKDILQGTVELIPPSWQHPEVTCGRIILEDKEYKTKNFKETKWKQGEEIIVHGEPLGNVEVRYLEERPESDEGPFLKEERDLINAIAKRVGEIIENHRANEALRESQEHFRSLMENATNFAVYRLVYDKKNPNLLSVVFVSPSIVGLTGVSYPMEFESWFRNIHPDDVDRVVEANRKAFKTNKFNEEMRVYHPLKREWRWIHVISSGVRTKEGDSRYVNGIIIDTTKEKALEEELKNREKELENKATVLEETNTALKVLLRRREEDKTELEEKVLFNVKELTMIFLEKLKNSGLSERQVPLADIIESNLNDIISPFSKQLSSKYWEFTPKEIQVANLVKAGKTTKEISELLNSSMRVIEFHRGNLRKKLGLKDRKANLRSRLLDFS